MGTDRQFKVNDMALRRDIIHCGQVSFDTIGTKLNNGDTRTLVDVFRLELCMFAML